MRLTRIKVENHSRLMDSEVEVRDHLVLVGPNDVGKSSLLRCLDLLLGASAAQLYNRITPEDFSDTSQPLLLEGELEHLDTNDQALFADEADVDPTTGLITLTVRLSATVDSNGTLAVDRQAPFSGTNRQLSRAQVQALGWTLLGATAVARDLREDRRTALNEILQRVDLGHEKAGFDTLIAQIQDQLKMSPVLDGLRGDLADHLSRALPTDVTKDELSFVTRAMADGDVLADVRMRIERGGTSKDFTEQSDGLRALYALALHDLVSAGANMVAVDEPEIHLHPTSQRSLARVLKAGPNQKLLATHSPDIVSAFGPESIVSVRSGGRLVQPARGFLTDDEKLVVHWWVRDKLEPLTASGVLAVEGVSDRIIVEAVADLTGRNLDRLGISVVQTLGSNNMRAIIKLFGTEGFDVPVTMLIDEDARSDTARILGVPPGDVEKHGVVVSAPDLESEYIDALGPGAIWAALCDSGLFSAGHLGACPRSGPAGVPTAAELRAFITNKHKVAAAMAVSGALDASTATQVTSVHTALSAITGS